MNRRQLFYRNAQARDHLELFLVSAVSSLLLLRFYLYLTGYPQVGGGSLHIAHMLYGGLFMMVSIVINLSFLGIRSERVAALIGGVGFGVFIDELGKFITKDNNYFFRPTIGIIYAVFCILFLTFNFLSRRQKLTNEEYQLNALRQFEEAVVNDMDRNEKAAMHDLLARADPDNFITKELKDLLRHVHTVHAEDSRLQKLRRRVTDSYARFWQSRESSRLVTFIFALQATILVLTVLYAVYHNFHSITDLFGGHITYGRQLIVGQLVASLVSASFVFTGAYMLQAVSRARAFEWFRRAILVNIFLTEFFIFSRVQFHGIGGFIINLILLIILHFAIEQERHSQQIQKT
jgi:hypothetical protein